MRRERRKHDFGQVVLGIDWYNILSEVQKSYMRTIFLFLALAAFIACNNNDQTGESSPDSTSNASKPADTAVATITEACYRKVLARDTFAIRIVESGYAVSGDLVFDNYEKDSSRGRVKGVVVGDILKLWYDFQSEGTRSVMEVYFKKQGDKLIRGIGTVDVKGDTSYFKDPSDIKYEDKETWSRVDCGTMN